MRGIHLRNAALSGAIAITLLSLPAAAHASARAQAAGPHPGQRIEQVIYNHAAHASAAPASFPHSLRLSLVSSRLSGQRAVSRTIAIPAGVAKISSSAFGVRFSVTKSAIGVPQTISCTVSAEPPFEYYGGTYGGGEEGIGEVSCTAVVYEIQVAAALQDNSTVVASGSNTVYETSEASADAVYRLSPGDYYTGAETYVTGSYGGSATPIGPVWNGPVYLP